MHPSAFEYVKPSDNQIERMDQMRAAFARCSEYVDALLPECADKTYVQRTLRTAAMWANVAITRQANGEPRPDYPADHLAPGDLGSVPL